MPSDRGVPEGSPGDVLSLKPLINCMMGGGIAMSPGMVAGAVSVGVVVDVGIGVGVVVDVGIGVGVFVDGGGGVGIGAGKGMDSTTPSSWTDWHRGDLALGGLSLTDSPCGGVGEREWTTRLVLLLL